MSRSVWWAFAAAGAAALVAAALVAPSLVTPLAGHRRLADAGRRPPLRRGFRAPGGVARAVPFLGAAGSRRRPGRRGPPRADARPRISLIAIGIWGVVAGAGYLAVARFARAFHVPDGGLSPSPGWARGRDRRLDAPGLRAWRASTFAPAAALAATGAISILAAVRLRVLPDEAPPVLSHREARRRERSGPRP